MPNSAKKNNERLNTERLLLRKPLESDANLIFERYACDPDVCKYLAWPMHETIEDTLAFISFSDHQWDQWSVGPYLVFSAPDDRLLGSTGLEFESETVATTGYVFAKDSWGKGYATETLVAMLGLARELGAVRVYSHVFPEHTPSRRVLEKAGLQLDDTIATTFAFPNLDRNRKFEVVTYAWDAD